MDGLTQMPASLTIEKHLMNPPGTSVVIEIDPKTAKAILDTRNGKTGRQNQTKSSSLPPTWQRTGGV